jgi:serine/threonine-protein kinase
MLAGRRAFRGQTSSDTMAAILTEEPPSLSAVNPAVPSGVARVVHRCLAKSRDERFESARDIVYALEATLEGRAAPRTTGWLPWTAAAAAAVLSGALAYTWSRSQPAAVAPAPIRATVETPDGARLVPGDFVPFALSPDGATLAYVTRQPEPERLFLRRLDGFDVSQMVGSDAAYDPFFSPDSRWVGFWANGRIKKVAVTGGPPAVICDAADMLGASWGEDGSIVFAPGLAGLQRVSAEGGTPVTLTTLDAGRREVQHTFPQIVGRGGRILFTAVARAADAPFSVDLYDAATGARRTLVPDARYGRLLPTGHLAYVRDRTVFVVKVDATTLQPAGDAVPILRNVETGESGEALLSVAATGTLAYFEHAPAANNTLVLVDRAGVTTDLGLPPRPYRVPRLSPDGRRLAINVLEDARTEIWLSAMPPVTFERLTFGRHNRFAFNEICFHPDGLRILYAEDADEGSRLVSQTLEGSRATETVLSSSRRIAPARVTRSETVLVNEFGAATGADILLLKRGGMWEPLVADPHNQWGPALSPDEQFIAYASEETGTYQVFLTSLADRSLKRQLTTDGGGQVRWSRDGREIFYRNGTRMMAIPIAVTPRLSTGPPRVLFEGAFAPGGAGLPTYDVTPDGRFLMMKAETARAPRQLRLITNWLEEVKRLVQ